MWTGSMDRFVRKTMVSCKQVYVGDFTVTVGLPRPACSRVIAYAYTRIQETKDMVKATWALSIHDLLNML